MSIPPLEHLDHIGSFLADLERLSEFSTSLASERGKVVSQISGPLLFDGLTGSLNDTNRHTNILPKNRCPFDKTLFFGPVSCFPLKVHSPKCVSISMDGQRGRTILDVFVEPMSRFWTWGLKIGDKRR